MGNSSVYQKRGIVMAYMDTMVKLHYASIGASNKELSDLLSDAANEIIALRVEARQLSQLIEGWKPIKTFPYKYGDKTPVLVYGHQKFNCVAEFGSPIAVGYWGASWPSG